MYKIKSDKYKSARGGQSRVLDITCDHCAHHIAYYQKDGPGLLKRMYLDRIIDGTTWPKELQCASCHRLLGVKMLYEKEQRPAYRLFAGAVHKKVINSRLVP